MGIVRNLAFARSKMEGFVQKSDIIRRWILQVILLLDGGQTEGEKAETGRPDRRSQK